MAKVYSDDTPDSELLRRILDGLEQIQKSQVIIVNDLAALKAAQAAGKATRDVPGLDAAVGASIAWFTRLVHNRMIRSPISKDDLIAEVADEFPEFRDRFEAKNSPLWTALRSRLLDEGWLVQRGAPRVGVFNLGPKALEEGNEVDGKDEQFSGDNGNASLQ